VWYVEDDMVWPYDPVTNTITNDMSYAVGHVKNCLERIGMADRWAFRYWLTEGACWGLSEQELNELYVSCDVMLNIVGATELRDEHMKAKLRVYVETDPVGPQLRLATGDELMRLRFETHHRVITYGENYGAPDCNVPLDGITYWKTRQPIDLDLWPMVYDPEARYFTTIGNYRQSGDDVEYNGDIYRWSKHHEWEKFMDLPGRTSQQFELALKIDEQSDQDQLVAHGWRIISPLAMSLDVFGAYPEYFQKSRGEFTVAKDQNIRLRSGWFSERDACYLASGKPVVAQDTGFSNILPTGAGLFAFTTMDEAVAAIEEINSDYERHCYAARDIAQEYFDAPKVAARLIEDLGL
jgi:hypothetical protein